MNTIIFGQYCNGNFTEINFKMDDINSTILHETIHMRLTLTTTWGILSYAMRKVSYCDHNKYFFVKFLKLHTLKVHESIAVFLELILFLRNHTFDDFKEHIDNLKKKNRKYYKYVQPLLPLIFKLREIDECSFIDRLNEISFLAYFFAEYSLNTNILNTEVVSKKQLQKFISNVNISGEILPFRKFKECIKLSIEQIDLKKELNINEIIKSVATDYFENDVEEVYKNKLKVIKTFITTLYNDSKHIEEIEKYLDTINLREIEASDFIAYTIPNSFSNYISAADDKKSNFYSNDDGICFYLGDVEEIIKFIGKYMDTKSIEAMEGHLKDKHFFIRYSIKNKTRHFFILTLKEAKEIINKTNLPVLIQYKMYDINIDKGLMFNGLNKKIFIYCDRSYHDSIEIIKSLTIEKKQAMIIDYDNLSVFLIKINENYFFILPILSAVCETIIKDCKNNKINVEISIENFITDKLLKDLDLIVNSVFEL